MKTTKLIAIVLILGIASLGMSQTRPVNDLPDTKPQSIVIQLKKAIHDPGLQKAMHQQLNPNFLRVEKPSYTVSVKYKGRLQYINATRGEWKNFFRSDMSEGSQGAVGRLIPLKRAMHIPNLLGAMRAQLTPAILKADKPVYNVPVRYKHSIVYVSGSYGEWKRFFSIKAKSDPKK